MIQNIEKPSIVLAFEKAEIIAPVTVETVDMDIDILEDDTEPAITYWHFWLYNNSQMVCLSQFFQDELSKQMTNYLCFDLVVLLLII